MATINDTKFNAYMKSIQGQLNKDTLTESNAKKMYEEWKNKGSVNVGSYKPQVINKQTTTLPTSAVGKATEPEGTTKIVGGVTYKVVSGKYVPQRVTTNKVTNDVLKAEEALNKAETDKKNKIESGVTDIKEKKEEIKTGGDITYNNESAYQKGMTDAANTYQDLLNKKAEDLNLTETEYARLAESKLKGILDPLMEKYGENTAQFTKILDQAMEQNKISIANQRKIADSFKEAAGVEALIAGSKVGPGMSESQITALGKDISQGYQKGIAEAEGNYEQARINGWNMLKTLGMDGKMAQDALLTVTEKLGLSAAEPYLLSLANTKTNLSDVINKVNDLKSGTYTKQYADAEQKKITQDAYVQREAEWASADDAKKRMIINTSTPVGVIIPADMQDKIIKGDINWSNLYPQLLTLEQNAKDQVLLVQQQIANKELTSEQGAAQIAAIGTLKQKQFDNLTKGNLQTSDIDIGEVKKPVNTTTQTDLSKMNNTVNTTKEDKVIQTAKTNVNASYEKYIAGLKPTDKTMLDKVKTLSTTKKTEAINKINASNKSPAIKAALIYYINK